MTIWKFFSKIVVPVLANLGGTFQRANKISGLINHVGLEAYIKIKYPFISLGKYIIFNLDTYNRELKLRKNSIDSEVFKYTFYDQFHKPISQVNIGSAPLILDFGANIGFSVLMYKHWYPDAKIIAFELDQDNYNLAIYNTRGLENVTIHNKAISDRSSIVSYNKSGREDGYVILDPMDNCGDVKIESLSINDVISEYNITTINYVKIDIEGTEVDILRAKDLSWMRLVKNINIEFHTIEDDMSEFIDILTCQGFEVYRHDDHWSSISGIRRN